MSSAFDAASVAGTAVPGPATSKILTWSHTCTGSDPVLSVWVAVGASPDTGLTITSVTYGGVAMTGGTVVHNDGQTVGFIQRFTLVGPATGANSVVITLSAIPDTVIGGAISATGSSGTGTEYTAYGDSGGDGTGAQAVTIAVNTAGNLIGAGMGYGSPDAVAQSPSTARWDDAVNEDTGGGCSVGATTVATGSSLTMHWAGAYDFWGLIAVEFLAAGGGSTPVSGSDTGAGADSGTVAAALGGADTGSGAGLGKIGVTGTDTGSGADSGSVSAAATGSDTASGAGSAAVGVAAAETASGADAGAVAAAVPAADAGAGTDLSRIEVTGADTGTGADTATVTLGAASSDTGAGSDSASVTAAVSAADTGSGADLGVVGVAGTDTGAGSDTATAVPAGASVSGSDAGSGADAASIGVTPADTGTGADAASVVAHVTGSDTGTGHDIGSVPGSDADSGAFLVFFP